MDWKRIIEVEVSGGYVISGEERIDPFDVVDSLHGSDDKILLHDTDGRRRNKQQLDLIQDLSAEITVWYEGGLRNSDNIIDPIVAGAERVVVNPAYFSANEFESAIRMTDGVVIDLDFEHADNIRDVGSSEQGDIRLRNLLGLGYSEVILSPSRLKEVVVSLPGAALSFWIRTDGPVEEPSQLLKRIPVSAANVKGRVVSLKELEEKDG